MLTMNAARGAGIVVPVGELLVRAMSENGNGSTKQVKMNAFRSLYGARRDQHLTSIPKAERPVQLASVTPGLASR